ncbi:MAG: hypothetical protein JXA09_12575 [Anaerolineae bacterium]|nr:hypothetical protein [Anaerolineae bacterium]
MEFHEYVRIVRRRAWIVVVLALLLAGVAYLYGERQTPIYEARLTISVRPARTDLDLGQTVSALLRSLAGDITTHSFLQQVIDRGGFGTLSTDKLLNGKTLFVEAKPGDFAIDVAVRDPDPGIAVGVANEIAALFTAQREAWNEEQDQEDRIALETPDLARNADLSSPSSKVYVAAGGALGASLGAAIAALLEWSEASRVRTWHDVLRLSVPVLGTIPPRPARRRRPSA